MNERNDNRLGFIGVGTMGLPIASNLMKAGSRLTVWNRTSEKTHSLQNAGAEIARDPAEVFNRTNRVIIMLASGEAIDDVLERGTASFANLVAGHLIVNMGTTSPTYSRDLDRDLRAAGARYVEAPVSGQKALAESGQLIGLIAGDSTEIEVVKPIVSAVCSSVLVFGVTPSATAAKFALSVYQGTAMAALAEAVNYAAQRSVDLRTFSELFNLSPLASVLTKMQLRKLINRDFSVQASVEALLTVVDALARDAGREGVAIPLVEHAKALYEAEADEGGASRDVTAVIKVFEQMSGV